MAETIVFNGQTLEQPGVYSDETVNSLGGNQFSDSGIIGIVGEAAAGEPGSTAGVQTFYASQIGAMLSTYKSGPLVDVAKTLIAPARDGRVPNGAQIIRAYKTNDSTKAASFLKNVDTSPVNLYLVNAKNYGTDGNLTSFYVTQGGTTDDYGTITSDTDCSFPITVATAATLVVTVNGTPYTLTVSIAPGGSISLTQANTILLLNGTPVTVGPDTATPSWAPSKPLIFAASSTTKITGVIDPAVLTSYANELEYALVTVTTNTLPTALGLTAASTVNSSTLVVTPKGLGPIRGSRGTRIPVFVNNATTETINENPGYTYMSIYYTGSGSPATMSVSLTAGVKYLTTACTGQTGDNLNIKLSDYTIKQLVEFIDANSAYTCVTSFYNASSVKADIIDFYHLINIKSLPLDVKGMQDEIETQVNSQSNLATFVLQNEIYGTTALIASTARRYLTGGTLGSSGNTDFQDGFDALLGVRCTTVMPCIAQDASDDITAGVTDPASTYTISSVIVQADTHCRTASNTKNRSERNAYVGFLGTFEEAIAEATALNSEFTSMAFQNVNFLNAAGSIVTGQPYIVGAMLAGM